MAKCISLSSARDKFLKYSFSYAGLKSTTTDLGDGTVIHVWVPKTTTPSKPNLLLIHGLGANAMWQWHSFISPLLSKFNLYIPDLVFFGASHTTRPERSEQFQAQCVMSAMARLDVPKMNVAGMSYGGYVAYSIAAQYPEVVERVVICCSGVCMELTDYDKGMFTMKTQEEAVEVFMGQTPEKLRELTKISFHKPAKFLPNFFLADFIDALNSKHVQERKELIEALHTERKICNPPKITQPTLLIWGENDLVFPLELAHRLKSHLGENSELVVLKEAGHALNMEKPKELCQLLISFLVDHTIPSTFLDQSGEQKQVLTNKKSGWKGYRFFQGLGGAGKGKLPE